MVKQKIFQKNLMLVVTMLNLLAFQSSFLAASGLIGSAAPYFRVQSGDDKELTLGPATESAEMLRKLVEAGTDVFRLNFSHGTVSEHQSIIRRIRVVEEETGKPVAILQDLPGPKIRLGVFKDGSVELHAGDRFRLTTEDVPGDHESASVSYAKLPDEVRPGQSILLADGTVEFAVESVAPREIICRVVLGGVLTNHKGVNAVGGEAQACPLSQSETKSFFCPALKQVWIWLQSRLSALRLIFNLLKIVVIFGGVQKFRLTF